MCLAISVRPRGMVQSITQYTNNMAAPIHVVWFSQSQRLWICYNMCLNRLRMCSWQLPSTDWLVHIFSTYRTKYEIIGYNSLCDPTMSLKEKHVLKCKLIQKHQLCFDQLIYLFSTYLTKFDTKMIKWNEITQLIWLWMYQEQFVNLSITYGQLSKVNNAHVLNFVTSSAFNCHFNCKVV